MTLRSIRDACVGEGRYIRQRSSVDRYGHVVIRLSPGTTRGFTYEWSIEDESIPRKYELAIFRGIRRAAAHAFLTRIHVAVIGGSYNATDSGLFAFKVAGALALQDALSRAVLVEAGEGRLSLGTRISE